MHTLMFPPRHIYTIANLQVVIKIDWEQKYLEKLEQDLAGIRRQLDELENKLTDNLDRSMTRLVVANKERIKEYMSLNERIDGLSGKVDRAVQWTVKFSLGTFLAVCGLVIAIVAKFS